MCVAALLVIQQLVVSGPQAQTTILAGTDDSFAPPADPASPSPDVVRVTGEFGAKGLTLEDFDLTRGLNGGALNRHVAHTFVDLPPNIVAATLEARVRSSIPCGTGPCGGVADDGIRLGFTDAYTPAWDHGLVVKRTFGDSPYNDDPGVFVLGRPWGGGTGEGVTDERTLVLDLADVGRPGVPRVNLIPGLNSHGFLDVNVEDDSAADFYRLTLTTASIAKAFATGPWREDDAGELVPFDVDGLGRLDEGRLIGVGLDHAQHYAYTIAISHAGAAADTLDGLSFLDVLPDGFKLDPKGEAFDDSGTVKGACLDGTCDGIIQDLSCPVTTSGPGKGKKAAHKYLSIEPEGLPPGTACWTTVFAVTVEGDTGDKKKDGAAFAPTQCQYATTGDDTLITNTVPMNDGVRVFEKVSDTFLFGPVGPLLLRPINCP
jgi:hypothetical protein